MKKIVFLLGLFFSACVLMNAQQSKPVAAFKSVMYDFGDVNEEKGRVSYNFEVTNKGSQPLVIQNAVASCGCTTPEWTKMPIPPGGKGVVTAKFDPAIRPGPFNKTITVTTNAVEPTTILRITGKVIPKPLTVEVTYPNKMDAIRLKASHIPFTRVAPGTLKTETLELINTSNKKVKIEFENIPAHITIKAKPEVVGAGQKGLIEATFDASKKSDWGFVVDQVYVVVDGKKDMTANRLSLSATIEEDFSSLTPEQLAQAPKAEFSEKSFDFGKIIEGNDARHEFSLINTGKSNLIIRKVKASCGCTAVQPAKMVLAPGESTTIATVFNSNGKSGKQNKSITITTNDPVANTVVLQITGEVTPK
jgi:hypothetical protein